MGDKSGGVFGLYGANVPGFWKPDNRTRDEIIRDNVREYALSLLRFYAVMFGAAFALFAGIGGAIIVLLRLI